MAAKIESANNPTTFSPLGGPMCPHKKKKKKKKQNPPKITITVIFFYFWWDYSFVTLRLFFKRFQDTFTSPSLQFQILLVSMWSQMDMDGFRPVTAGSSQILAGFGLFRVIADGQNMKIGGLGTFKKLQVQNQQAYIPISVTYPKYQRNTSPGMTTIFYTKRYGR